MLLLEAICVCWVAQELLMKLLVDLLVILLYSLHGKLTVSKLHMWLRTDIKPTNTPSLYWIHFLSFFVKSFVFFFSTFVLTWFVCIEIFKHEFYPFLNIGLIWYLAHLSRTYDNVVIINTLYHYSYSISDYFLHPWLRFYHDSIVVAIPTFSNALFNSVVYKSVFLTTYIYFINLIINTRLIKNITSVCIPFNYPKSQLAVLWHIKII